MKVQIRMIVATFLALLFLVGCANLPDTSTQTSPPDTLAVTTAPAVITLLQRPVLGSTDATFIGKYGKPIAKTTSNGLLKRHLPRGIGRLTRLLSLLNRGQTLFTE
jgi:hypothetical protein